MNCKGRRRRRRGRRRAVEGGYRRLDIETVVDLPGSSGISGVYRSYGLKFAAHAPNIPYAYERILSG